MALAALREDKNMAEVCKKFELHPTQINDWKLQLLDGAAGVLGSGAEPVDLALMRRIDELHLGTPSWAPECLAACWLAKASS